MFTEEFYPQLKRWALMLTAAACVGFYAMRGSNDLRVAQESAFQLAAMLVLAVFVADFYVGAFLALNVIHFYLSGEFGASQVMNVTMGTIVFYFSREFFKERSIRLIRPMFLWIAGINLCFMIAQAFGLDPLFVGRYNGTGGIMDRFTDPVGLFGIKMANGIFWALTAPILASYWLPLILIPAILIIFMHSSLAMLAYLVASVAYLWFTKRRKIALIAIGVAVLAGSAYILLDQKDDPKTFRARFGLWRAITHAGFVKPLGYGPDSFRNFTPTKDFLYVSDSDYKLAILKKSSDTTAVVGYMTTSFQVDMVNKFKTQNNEMNIWDNPHNEYLQMLFEYGWPGLILLLLMIWSILRSYLSAINPESTVLFCGLLVFFVSALAHFPCHLARTGIFFAILLGAFRAKTCRTQY